MIWTFIIHREVTSAQGFSLRACLLNGKLPVFLFNRQEL